MKDVQATGEAFSPQKIKSSILSTLNLSLFPFCGFAHWIRIRVRQKSNADPWGSGSSTFVSRKKENNVEYQIAFPGVHNWIKCRTKSRVEQQHWMKIKWKFLASTAIINYPPREILTKLIFRIQKIKVENKILWNILKPIDDFQTSPPPKSIRPAPYKQQVHK